MKHPIRAVQIAFPDRDHDRQGVLVVDTEGRLWRGEPTGKKTYHGPDCADTVVYKWGLVELPQVEEQRRPYPVSRL